MLNDQGQLSKTYQGLTKDIAAKYGGTERLSTLKYQACSHSSISRTMFLLDREYKIHIHPTCNKLPLTRTPIKTTWQSAPGFWLLPHNNKQMNENMSINYTYIASPLLHKYNIPSHIQSSDMKNYDKIQSNPKSNKGALQQASTLFSTNAPPLQPTWSYTTPLPTIAHILNPNLSISPPTVSQSTPSLAPRPLLWNGGLKL